MAFHHSSSTWHVHKTRSLNIVESTKESVVNTYQDVKGLVERNLILSISVAAGVLLLLMLCCYIRRKHARNAQAMTQAEHDRLVAEQGDRKRRSKDKSKSKRSTNDKRREKKRRSHKKNDGNLANKSFETQSTFNEQNYSATVLPDTDQNYCDIEKGGVETKLRDGSFRNSTSVSSAKTVNDSHRGGVSRFFKRKK